MPKGLRLPAKGCGVVATLGNALEVRKPCGQANEILQSLRLPQDDRYANRLRILPLPTVHGPLLN